MNSRYCNGMIYVVKKGDTLYGISRQFRVPLALILRANPYVDVYNLQVGTEICVPMGRPNPMPPMNYNCPCQNGNQPGPGMGRPMMDQSQMGRPMMEQPEMKKPMVEQPEMGRPMMEQPEKKEEPEKEMPQMEQQEETKGQPYDVEVTDGNMTLGQLLKDNGLTCEEFMKINDLDQILLAKGVVVYLPKKV